jgi:methionine-rich copper-binding protein CopC
MNKILRTAAVFVTAAAVTSAFAHAKLQKSEPENGSTVTISPTALKLHYNEPVEAAMSSVKVIGHGDVAVQAGKPVLAEGNDSTLAVAVPKLPSGDYRVEWSTMGHDGHHTKGELHFSVK